MAMTVVLQYILARPCRIHVVGENDKVRLDLRVSASERVLLARKGKPRMDMDICGAVFIRQRPIPCIAAWNPGEMYAFYPLEGWRSGRMKFFPITNQSVQTREVEYRRETNRIRESGDGVNVHGIWPDDFNLPSGAYRDDTRELIVLVHMMTVPSMLCITRSNGAVEEHRLRAGEMVYVGIAIEELVERPKDFGKVFLLRSAMPEIPDRIPGRVFQVLPVYPDSPMKVMEEEPELYITPRNKAVDKSTAVVLSPHHPPRLFDVNITLPLAWAKAKDVCDSGNRDPSESGDENTAPDSE